MTRWNDIANALILSADMDPRAAEDVRKLLTKELTKLPVLARARFTLGDPFTINVLLPRALEDMRPAARERLVYEYAPAHGSQRPALVFRMLRLLTPGRQSYDTTRSQIENGAELRRVEASMPRMTDEDIQAFTIAPKPGERPANVAPAPTSAVNPVGDDLSEWRIAPKPGQRPAAPVLQAHGGTPTRRGVIQFQEVDNTGVYFAELHERFRAFRDSMQSREPRACEQHFYLRIDTRKGPGRIEMNFAFEQRDTWYLTHSDPGFKSLADAFEFAERWLAECQKQQTIAPSMSRPDLGWAGRMASAVRENYRR